MIKIADLGIEELKDFGLLIVECGVKEVHPKTLLKPLDCRLSD